MYCAWCLHIVESFRYKSTPEKWFCLNNLSFQALKEKELGNEAYKKKDFETAIKHYDGAIELDPENITFLLNKAGRILCGYCQVGSET